MIVHIRQGKGGGGKQSAKQLSKQERVEKARKAAAARWGKKKPKGEC